MLTGWGAGQGLARGQENALYSTLSEFHKYWERIDIILPRVKAPVVTELFGNVYLHVAPVALWLYPWWFFNKAKTLFAQVGFDLMVVHEFAPFYNGLAARFLNRMLKVPYIVEIHHVPGFPRASNLKERLYCRLTRWLIAWDVAPARAVRVVNQTEVPQFLIRAGVPSRKLIYIPSFYIDLAVFKPRGVEKKYDLIFVGRLAQNKGVELFLGTVQSLKIKAIVVGTGPLEQKLKRQSKKLQAEVIFHGWAEDSQAVATLLNQSRLFIMTSYNEGGPRVVLEAMACGVPVLATPVGIVRDVIKDGVTGYLVDWRVQDIVQKAKYLLKNEAEYQKFSQAGPRIALQFEKHQAIANYASKLNNLK